MSSEVTIHLSFPLGARFVRNPEMIFYHGYISFLKSLFCVNADKNCDICPFSEHCRFYKMTGNQFRDFPGILMRTSYFTKLRYRKSDELELKLYFIGIADRFTDSCILYLREHLNQKLAGQFFNIKDHKTELSEEKLLNSKKIIFSAPVQNKNIAELISNQIAFYNANFDTEFECPSIMIDKASLKEEKRSGHRICGKYIPLKGYIGTATGHFTEIPSFLAEYGLGNNNCIGGGQFEIEDIIA